MALVPYRVSGPAADQRAAERLFVVGGHTIRIQQLPQASGSLRAPGAALQPPAGSSPPAPSAGSGGGGGADSRYTSSSSRGAAAGCDEVLPPRGSSETGAAAGPPPAAAAGVAPLESLSNVGLVVWQSGFVLLDYLLRTCPMGPWVGVRCVDLGTGTGLVGIGIALGGAAVCLTDLPHVLPLARENVAANCDPVVHRTEVREYCWGDDPSPLGSKPDVITAADVLYHPELFVPLMDALRLVSAAHTVSYVSYKVRHGQELRFVEVADAAGFAAEEVPRSELHEEYGDGQYGILRLCLRDGDASHHSRQL